MISKTTSLYIVFTFHSHYFMLAMKITANAAIDKSTGRGYQTNENTIINNARKQSFRINLDANIH